MTFTVKLEVGFAGSFLDDPDDITWTDLTDRLSKVTAPQITARLGRGAALSDVPQPGSLSMTLQNMDGALTPKNDGSAYYPKVTFGVPVRVTAQDTTGTYQPVFYGFARGWNARYLNAAGHKDWSEVILTCGDGLVQLNRAGQRLTYRDRVLTDFAGNRGLSWLLAGYVEERTTAGVTDQEGINQSSSQKWGLVWFKLEDGSWKDWTDPCAGGVIAETGFGDHFSYVSYTETSPFAGAWIAVLAGFESDRPGGTWVYNGTSLTVAPALGDDPPDNLAATPDATGGGNYQRQILYVGRPPEQLTPADVMSGASTGWTATGGTISQVDADALSWTTRRQTWDPATGARATVIVGPSKALAWTGFTLTDTLVSDPIPVTAGEYYAPHLSYQKTSGAAVAIKRRWLDSGGSQVGSDTTVVTVSTTNPGVAQSNAGEAVVAPAGAASMVWVIDPTSGSPAGTVIVLHSMGCYAGTPSLTTRLNGTSPVRRIMGRWWDDGASDDLYLWGMWPLDPADLATLGISSVTMLWITCELVVDWLPDEVHAVEWNVYPGVNGHPVLFIDGVDVTADATWYLSYSGDANGWDHPDSGTQQGYGVGLGFSTYQTHLTALQPSTVTPLWGVIGVDNSTSAPDADLADAHYSQYGAPDTIGQATLTSQTTDLVVASLLDGLAWPDALRDIDTGRSTATIAWTNGGTLNTYSDALSAAVAREYGWVDVGPDGKFRWLPRRWYEDSLSGTAAAQAKYTYDQAADSDASEYTYQRGIEPDFVDDEVFSTITVATSASPDPAQHIDYTLRRRWPQEKVVSGSWLTQTEVDEVRDILAAQYAADIRLTAVTLVATSSDDPTLDEILTRRAGDVVLNALPTAGSDLVLPVLVQSITHSITGSMWSATFALAPCPVPATFAGVEDTNPAYPSETRYPSETDYPSEG